ncbi:hypothetical protein IAU60_002839 [Kwoniella sp. DSM 27419]
MPPKKDTQGDAAPPPASRRSARIADKPPSEQPAASGVNGDKKATASKKEPASKKRLAGAPANGTKDEAKKAKPADQTKGSDADGEKVKSAAKGKTGTNSTKATASTAAKKEAEAEAPADAEPETGPRGQLKKGDKLPKVTIKDNTGADVDVSTLAADKGVVIFLYPKADTPGCTTQACGYRDNYDQIAEFGYDIYGLSKDKPEAQQKWINKKELTYKLLCDPESKFIKRLGAFVAPNNTKRSHFIFEKGSGKLVDIALGVKPADDPSNVLKFLKQHHA